MKKSKSGPSRKRAKEKAAPKTVDEYLVRVPEPARSTLQKTRAAIRSAAPPEAIEAISYGIPALKLNGTLVWYAAFSDHCSLFPTSTVIAAFRKELQGYRTTKGTIHFPIYKPLPAALVKKMVKMRVAQDAAKKRR